MLRRMKIKVDPRAESMDTWALQCRSENHHWTRTGEAASKVVRGIIREIEVIRHCAKCDAHRTDIYSLPTFALLKRRYRYAPDFKLKVEKGEERPDRAAFRAAYLARELKDLFK